MTTTPAGPRDGNARTLHLKLVNNHEPTMWLRERIADVDNWPPGCRHTRTGKRITLPIVAPLWDEALWCAVCAPAARLPGGSPQDRTCDRCGRVCATVLGDKIYPCQVPVLAGVVVVLFGLCGTCWNRELARTPAAAPRGGGDA